jgi:hypothetical protein
MKFIHFLFAVIFTLVIAACGNESADKTPATTPEAAPASSTGTTPAATTNQTLTPLNTSGSVAMNPAHGQPGHRCDIPVGAPLDGSLAPAGQTNPLLQTQTTPAKSPIEINQTPATTAEGMNPPHGQPNHRCDIAVGAPLNSPPKQ